MALFDDAKFDKPSSRFFPIVKVGYSLVITAILFAALCHGTAFAAQGGAPSTPTPANPAPTPTAFAPASDLARRVTKVEAENVHLRAEIAALRSQMTALTESYAHHYHQVNGTVGNGVAFIEGKTVVTGSYVDMDLRRTGEPQPSFHPLVNAPLPPATPKAVPAKRPVKRRAASKAAATPLPPKTPPAKSVSPTPSLVPSIPSPSAPSPLP